MRVNRRTSPLEMIIDGNVTMLFAKCTNNEMSQIYQKIFRFRLNEMGRQHNKLLDNRLQEVKQDLLYQFQRIEVFYEYLSKL